MSDPLIIPGSGSITDKFISCDWGTSSLRLRLVDISGTGGAPNILGTLKTGNGIAATFDAWKASGRKAEERLFFYRAFLETQIEALQASLNFSLKDIPVLISGMASSSIGMKELPYKLLPFDTTGGNLHWEIFEATAEIPRRTLLVSGVRSVDDVMRGEEVQLIGCYGQTGNALHGSDGSEQVFVFPGTHSKHIWVRDGKVTDFKTYMTGEYFGLLSKYSILSGSISEMTGLTAAGAGAIFLKAFDQGVTDSLTTNLLHQSFLIRTHQLLRKMSKEENTHYLSGLLIGTECKELAGDGAPIVLVSEGALQTNYSRALRTLGITNVDILDLDQALIRGQAKIFRSLGK